MARQLEPVGPAKRKAEREKSAKRAAADHQRRTAERAPEKGLDGHAEREADGSAPEAPAPAPETPFATPRTA